MKSAEFLVLTYTHGIKPFDVFRQEGDDKCNCPCHEPGGESYGHIAPCCDKCDRCRMMIRTECIATHQQTCQGN